MRGEKFGDCDQLDTIVRGSYRFGMAKSKSIWWSSWLERQMVSASVGFLVWVPPVIAVIAGTLFTADPNPLNKPAYLSGSGLFHWFVFGLAVSAVLLILQHYFEFQRRTYDPTWIFRFVDTFDTDDFIELRGRAATVLKANQGRLRESNKQFFDIDPVLDFFDSIGFYQHGGQISPEVVHQEFEFWIRGYYQASREYMEVRQSDEATLWEHVAELFDTVEHIEAKRAKLTYRKFLSKEAMEEFLDAEIETWNTVKEKNRR